MKNGTYAGTKRKPKAVKRPPAAPVKNGKPTEHPEEPANLQAYRERARKAAELAATPLPSPVLASDFLKEPAPMPSWLVRELVLAQGVTAIGGIPGSGKTALVVRAVVDAALAGHKVLLFEQEGAKFFLQKKLALAGLTLKAQRNVSILYGQNVDLTSERWKEHFESLVVGVALVALDTLADVMPTDLLDHTAFGAWLGWLRDAVRNANAACVLVVHAPKATGELPRDPVLADLFGSQVLGGKIDCGFICRNFKDRRKKADEEEDFLATLAAVQPLKEVHCVKLRDGELLASRVGRLVPHPHNVAGVEPSTVAVFEWEGKSAHRMKAEMRWATTSANVLALLAEQKTPPRTRNVFWSACVGDSRRGKKETFYEVTCPPSLSHL